MCFRLPPSWPVDKQSFPLLILAANRRTRFFVLWDSRSYPALAAAIQEKSEQHGISPASTGIRAFLLSPFSFSTFPVSGLRVLPSMQETAGRAENRETRSTRLGMIFAQLNPAVRALRAGGF